MAIRTPDRLERGLRGEFNKAPCILCGQSTSYFIAKETSTDRFWLQSVWSITFAAQCLKQLTSDSFSPAHKNEFSETLEIERRLRRLFILALTSKSNEDIFYSVESTGYTCEKYQGLLSDCKSPLSINYANKLERIRSKKVRKVYLRVYVLRVCPERISENKCFAPFGTF